MMKRLVKLGAIWNAANNVLLVFGAAAIVFTMLSVSTDIFARNALGAGQPWVNEVNEQLQLLMVFAGTAVVLKRGGHVSVEVLLRVLKPKNQAFWGMITSIIGLFMCLIATWISVLVTLDFLQRGTQIVGAISIPRAPLAGIIVIGYFFLCIQFTIRAREYLHAWRV